MKEGLKYTGVISKKELFESKGFPSEERFKKGPVAVIECIQEIPCNPCETSCEFGAIKIGSPITNLPEIIEDKCIGCGRCIASCPGLAIFLEDHTYSKKEALVGIPYEYKDIPKVGDKVKGLNRMGEYIADVFVHRVVDKEENNKTIVLYVKVPKELVHEVRSIDTK